MPSLSKIRNVILPILLLAGGCTESTTVRAQEHTLCETPARVADLPAAIIEASGIVASRAHDGVLWVHNDGEPFLYALDADARQLGRVRLRTDIRDWEDLALGSCGGAACLYIADIGDNQHERGRISVYRVPEPAPTDARTAEPEVMHLRYPDGARDAEALFVLGERIHIVSKGRKGPIALYRAPAFAAGTTVTLEHVRAFTPGLVQFPDMVTGAALAPDASWVAIRTYSYVDFYRVAGDTLAERAAARTSLAALREPQGEGVALTADGELLLVSERNARGQGAPLSRARCTLR